MNIISPTETLPESRPTVIQFVSEATRIDLNSLKSPTCGALVMFEGMTRSTSGTSDVSRFVTELKYDGYEAMFYKIVNSIVQETRKRWPSVWGIGVLHRIGSCPLGETGVQVAVTAPHRLEAFASCEYLITTIKAQAPIWKKEYYSDGP